MPLSPGARLGPYEIIAPLGAGGMGEVYRARDTRLGREIALKCLPEHLSSNPEARERFEREAKAISSLNHPNICTLHDVGSEGGTAYLVMELLEGETLMTRLARGPMGVEEALPLAIQIADALDKAHRRGVVHRDLKPGNVVITKSGAKVLDFGIAKLREETSALTAPVPGMLPTATPTRTTPLTSQGAVLGTMQYMAPEQLEGKPIDSRADLFSFGALLYEMLAGRRAFEGASQASVIAAILERTPRPVSEISGSANPSIDRVIRRCLAKDPDERWQSAVDVRSELEWILQGAGPATGPITGPVTATVGVPAATPPTRRGLSVGIVAAMIVGVSAVMAAVGWALHRPPVVPAQVIRSSIVLPTGFTLDTDNSSIALSPDGTRLAYAGAERGAQTRIYVRSLDSTTAQPLAGTEGASYPTWSPDGSFIAYFSDHKLRKIPASGGTPQAICDAEDGRGAAWGTGDSIVFAPRPFGALMVVAASGGAPVQVTEANNPSLSHRNPHFLPDGKRVLFFSGTNFQDKGNGVYSLDLETKKAEQVLPADSEGIYVEPGYLAFVREGNLMAQRIDPVSLKLTGEAVPIGEGVQFNTFRFTGTYTFSPTGLMLYQSGAIQRPSQLTWYDLDGKKKGTVGEPAIFWVGLALSPDGKRAVVTVRQANGGSDLWMYDLARGLGSRFTLGETNALGPIWSPDGRQICYTDGANAILVKAVDGTSPAKRIYLSEMSTAFPAAWTPDGSSILIETQDALTGSDIRLLPLTGDAKPRVIVGTKANETSGTISADGRWIAYVSDDSGRNQAYVAPFPGPGGKWQVTADGAGVVLWVGGTRDLAWFDRDGRMFASTLTPSGAGLDIGPPRPLFGGQVMQLAPAAAFAADGRSFLAASLVAREGGPALTLVTNWPAAMAKR